LTRRDFFLGSSLPFVSFHPDYREQTPLDAVLLKANAELDAFPTEKLHDQIAAILDEWTRDMLSIGKFLGPGFLGTSFRPETVKLVRGGAGLQVHQVTFTTAHLLAPDAFLREWHTSLAVFSKILTAEFQITGIEAGARLKTRVRYELVGTGPGFHREQRGGFWDLEWNGGYLLAWRLTDEMRSRSMAPCYADITRQALGRNASYSSQLLHGVDYWRTVLDGACGIDIYGHNGVSVGDIDGDGFDDLYVCQPAGLPNRLFRNRGDGTFEDITEASGVGLLDNTACALFADFQNAGRQDLLVVRANGPVLFVNEGGGTFRRKPDAFQFANVPQGTFTGAAAADYDRDGWLDVYFCLYVYYQGADQYKYPVPYYDAQNGPPNFLMRNQRDQTFRDVTAQAGLSQNNTRYSFCCGWGDYNGNGWPDLYVVNDFGRKNLYRNNGDGTFTDIAGQANAEDVGAGMSVCWLDYDNDGADDLYVADMWTAAGERISRLENFKKDAAQPVRDLYHKHAMGNTLLRNNGKHFQDTTVAAQVGMGRWAWSSDAWDFDHDGFADLYITNGMVSGPQRGDLNSFFWRQVVANSPNEAKSSAEYEQGWTAINELIRADGTWSGFERNVVYANNRDGTFSDVSGSVDLDFLEDGRAFGLADFDHDGRQEVFLKNRNAPQLRVLKNVMADLPPSIKFHLQGSKSNRDAVGAAVTVGQQRRMLQAGSGFLSQHSKELFFGLGDTAGPVSARVRWPSGVEQEVHNLPVNHRIWLDEAAGLVRTEPFKGHAPVEAHPQTGEVLPESVETWLLSPVAAPDFAGTLAALRGKPLLLRFGGEDVQGVRSVAIDAAQRPEVAAIYNLLYRYLFDRHRDLVIPTSFLIDGNGDIVKIYRGAVKAQKIEEDARTLGNQLANALPFPGASETYEFGRNYLSLGSVLFQRGYPEQAESAFQRALRDDPASAEAQYGLGSVYLKQNQLVKAKGSFEQTLKLHASYPQTLPNAWNNLGLLATRAGNTDEAIGYFLDALRIDPQHFVALQNLGNAYRQEKRWGDARETLEHALVLKPQDAEANYALAMVFAQTDDSVRAYEYLQKALRARPDYAEALNNLGVLYLRTHRRDEAVQTFEHCMRVAPGFDKAYLNLAQVYVVEGSREKAREVLRDLLKQRPAQEQAERMLKQLQ
jgi:tetratricopeptide (TPR) repeat protein